MRAQGEGIPHLPTGGPLGGEEWIGNPDARDGNLVVGGQSPCLRDIFVPISHMEVKDKAQGFLLDLDKAITKNIKGLIVRRMCMAVWKTAATMLELASRTGYDERLLSALRHWNVSTPE